MCSGWINRPTVKINSHTMATFWSIDLSLISPCQCMTSSIVNLFASTILLHMHNILCMCVCAWQTFWVWLPNGFSLRLYRLKIFVHCLIQIKSAAILYCIKCIGLVRTIPTLSTTVLSYIILYIHIPSYFVIYWT